MRQERALRGARVWVRVAGGAWERVCEWGCGAREVGSGEAGEGSGRAGAKGEAKGPGAGRGGERERKTSGRTCGIWKFPGQGSSHSHCRSNAE